MPDMYDLLSENPILSPEMKLIRSQEEMSDLPCRPLRCSFCGFRLGDIYGNCMDAHIAIRCRKCKQNNPMNLAYYRTIKKLRHGKDK